MKLKSNTYRFVSLLLALLVLVSSVGYTANLHYCKGQLKSFSLLGKAKQCHEAPAMAMANCPHHQKMMAEKMACGEEQKNCCDSETLLFQSDTDKQVQQHAELQLSAPLQYFVLAYTAVFLAQPSEQYEALPNGSLHKIPLRTGDTYALLQTYLL